jgi:hypothetical protein
VGFLTFYEYVAWREGLLLPDKPPAAGLARINPFPATQGRLKRILARSPMAASAPRRPAAGLDYRAAVRHGLVP